MALVIVLAASLTLGRAAVAPLGLGRGLEAGLVRCFCGLALAAIAALGIGSVSLFWAQTLLTLTALAGIGAALLVQRQRAQSGRAPHARACPEPMGWFDMACAAALSAALAFALLSALAPSTSWDAAVAHLALPQDYAKAGRIYLEAGNVYSGYPHLLHSLYAIAYYPSYEKPVTLLNWSLALLACMTLYALGRRIESRRVGWIAAALLATAPIFLDQAGGVSIDLAFAAFTACALLAFARAFDEEHAGWLAAAAFLAGASCGVRHTGYLVCILLAAGVLFGARGRRFLWLALFAGVTLLGAAPWLLRSAIVVGNPVFPFLTAWFPGAAIDHIDVSALGAHESIARAGGMDIFAFLRFPWDIIMRPGQFDGWAKSPGGMILVLGIPGLLVGGRRVRALGAFSIAGGIAFFFFQRFARYLLPFFVPMMVAAGAAAVRIPPLRRAIEVLLLIAFAYGLALHAAAVHFKVPVVLGQLTREEYLLERVERYPAFLYANQRLSGGGTILTIDQRSYYLDPPAYQNYWGLQRISRQPYEAQLQWLRQRGIRYLLLPVTYLQESPAAARDFLPMLYRWTQDRERFELLDSLSIPRVRGAGFERVDVYAVRGADGG